MLESTSLQSVLAARKLKVSSFSAPKQTDTVQRWKVALHCGGIDIPTKIEISRRGVEQRGIEFSSISPIILSKYHITPTYLGHYSASLAIDQKIEALAGRPETQARDLYDLDLLLNRHPTAEVSTKPNTLLKAIECAMSIDQDQFRGQVVEFLEDDAKVYYASKSSFDTMQNRVITLLEGLQNASV